MMTDASRLDAVARETGFSGVISIDRRGDVEFAQGYGLAHRALRVPNTVATRFALASGGKSFTALAVMSLVDDGTLSLETPARELLGSELPLIDDAVTVEQLLTHTSGIGDYLDESGDWDAVDYVLPVPVHELATTEPFVPVIDGYPQKFAPGTRFSYCNGGYIVLALLAERASGTPYHDLVDERVCRPAGLRHTGFPRSDELPPDAAVGYLGDESDRTNVFHLPVRGNGDGGIYSSAPDLSAFWAALFAGRILPRPTIDAMIAPRSFDPEENLRYGAGFWLAADGPAVVLEGYDAGVSFRSTHDPATGTTVTIASNTSEGAWPVIAAGDQPA